MRKIWQNLQLRVNNYVSSDVETNASDVELSVRKNTFDEKLLSLQEDMSDILKEQEQRKKTIEILVRHFKTTAQKRFAKIKKGRSSTSPQIF